jgi:hypothetical protein
MRVKFSLSPALCLLPVWVSKQHIERFQMFISVGDLFAIAIALGTATALVITSVVRNAQLTKSRDAYREAYLTLKAGK